MNNAILFSIKGKIQGGECENTQDYRQLIALKAQQAMIKANLNRIDDEPLKVNIYAYFKMPEYFTKEQKEKANQRILRPINEPSALDIQKIYLDALNGVVWKDERQIIVLSCAKIYLLEHDLKELNEEEENVDVFIEKM